MTSLANAYYDHLDDDALEMVKQYAKSRAARRGKAVSELARSGVTGPRATRQVNGLQVFDLPPDSPKVTSKMVAKLEAGQKSTKSISSSRF